MSNNDGNPLLRACAGRTLRVQQGGFPGIEIFVVFSKLAFPRTFRLFSEHGKDVSLESNNRNLLGVLRI